jgi:hypothetical protein
MKVICAGLSKTGTKSLASALRTLGYSVHDVDEHWTFHMDTYIQALESTKMPDFAAMYANVDAVTDSPANHFVEEIFQAFPDAKVLLMLRDDEDVWLKSYIETIDVWIASIQPWWFIFGFVFTPTGRKWRRLLDNEHTKIWKSANKKDSDSKEVFKSVYREHNERIRAVIPRDKHLILINYSRGN